MSLVDRFNPREILSPGPPSEGAAAKLPVAPARADLLSPKSLAQDEPPLSDQFYVFQLNPSGNGPTIVEASSAEPSLPGSDSEPDAKAVINLQSFHIGESESVTPDTRATMRITIGGAPGQNTLLDTGLWAAAVGLKLYDDISKKRAPARDMDTDLHKAFNQRPIEIPGGLGLLQFDVVKHAEPRWYQKIFSFLEGGAGSILTSALGLPGVTQAAVGLIDDLVNRLVDDKPEILFKSRPSRFALTKRAKDEFTGGSPRVRVGALNKGFMVMARGRDFNLIAGSNATYSAQHGLLMPAGVSEGDFFSSGYKDPLRDVTYVIFKVAMKQSNLDPTIGF